MHLGKAGRDSQIYGLEPYICTSPFYHNSSPMHDILDNSYEEITLKKCTHYVLLVLLALTFYISSLIFSVMLINILYEYMVCGNSLNLKKYLAFVSFTHIWNNLYYECSNVVIRFLGSSYLVNGFPFQET